MTDREKYEIALSNYRDAMTAITLIHEAVQELFPGMPSGEAVDMLYGVEPCHTAQAIIEHLHRAVRPITR